jgi:hypothetical protein
MNKVLKKVRVGERMEDVWMGNKYRDFEGKERQCYVVMQEVASMRETWHWEGLEKTVEEGVNEVKGRGGWRRCYRTLMKLE